MSGKDTLSALASDRSLGATEITRRAAAELARIARASSDPLADTLAAGVTLIRGEPAMAPLFNLVNEGLLGLRKEGAAVFERLGREGLARERALAEEGAGLIEQDQTIVTYSRSSAVLGALKLATRSGRKLVIVLSEARPTDEGLVAARELALMGARVTVCIDAALPRLVREAGLVLVGADAVCAGGVVNKIGTGLVARVALDAGVPFVVLAGTDKFLPAAYAEEPPLSTVVSTGQMLAPGVRDEQPLFEMCPLDRIGLIVTEEGRVVPREVEARVRGMKVAPELVKALA